MAAIGKRRKRTAHKKTAKRHTRKQVIVVGKRRSRRKVSGTGIGKTSHHKKRRKSRGIMGATGGSKLKQIAEMAVGVAVGAAGTHMILRPLEHKVSQRYPAVTKFLGVAEVAIGGYIALKSSKPFIKSFGIGVLAGGVHTVMKQLPIGLHNPAEGNRMGDYATLNVPISGDMRETMAGLIENNPNRYVQTPVVSGLIRNQRGATRTNVVNGGVELHSTDVVNGRDDMNGLTEEERDFLYTPRGM